MTSGLWDVAGQEQAAAVLRRACERDEVAHAWAFVGPGGVGQEQTARALAAALNCPVSPQTGGCGRCDTCDRCRRGAYPAYWEFAPTGSMHRVVEVREQWLPAAFRTASEGRRKVLRVVDADRMNEAAANAFLKALEEPPQDTVWVLDVADPDDLPDTILSRCRVVRFLPWTPEVLRVEAQRLGITHPADVALAVRASLGRPEALRRLTAAGGLDDLRSHRSLPRLLRSEGSGHALVAVRRIDDEIKRRTAAVKADGRAELDGLGELYGDAAPRGVVKQVEERWSRREREARVAVVQAVLDDLVGWYRDCLFVGAGGDPSEALHADDPDGLRADAAALSAAELLQAVDQVQLLRDELIEFNLQQTLALEALLLDLAALGKSTTRTG